MQVNIPPRQSPGMMAPPAFAKRPMGHPGGPPVGPPMQGKINFTNFLVVTKNFQIFIIDEFYF